MIPPYSSWADFFPFSFLSSAFRDAIGERKSHKGRIIPTSCFARSSTHTQSWAYRLSLV